MDGEGDDDAAGRGEEEIEDRIRFVRNRGGMMNVNNVMIQLIQMHGMNWRYREWDG